MYKFTFILLLIFIFANSLYSQENEIDRKQIINAQENGTIDSPQAVTDKVEFKNETGNSIITITDEGNNAGSILLTPGSVPTDTTNKLYNVGGELYFNGSALGTSTTGGGWSRTGNSVILSNTSDYVGIGHESPAVNLHIKSPALDIQPSIRLANYDNFHSLSFFCGFSGDTPRISFKNSDALSFTFFDQANTRNRLEIMKLTSTGNVGIGTTNPTSLLHVNGINSQAKLATVNDGVYGESNTQGGSGVAGINTGNGNGIYGRSTNGFAGRFDGNVKVQNSVITDTIKSNNTINIESLNNIVLKTGNAVVTIKPNGEILIQSGSNVNIITDADLNLISQGNINMNGNNVNIGASTNLTFTSGNNIVIDNQNDFLLASGKDLHLEANDSLRLKTNNTLILENLNAFNKMSTNGDISIEGKNISIKASGQLITKGSNTPAN